MSTLLSPTTELVAVAYLGGLTGLSPAMVSTQLPRDTSTWKTNGFVTVRTVGGGMSIYTGRRSPVLAIDAWAVNPTSNKPPWFQANGLMELINAASRTEPTQTWLTLPSGYEQARVTTAYFLQEPQRVYADQGNFARYSAQLQLNWVAAT